MVEIEVRKIGGGNRVVIEKMIGGGNRIVIELEDELRPSLLDWFFLDLYFFRLLIFFRLGMFFLSVYFFFECVFPLFF